MNPAFVTNLLADNAERIRAMLTGVSSPQAQFKPSPESWSMLEVINHLCDEEREDFRVRLDLILHHPEQSWPPIDPAGWVVERSYNERELAPSLENFMRERSASLEWLESLGPVDWNAAHVTDSRTMRAGDMLASWAAHDQLHLRQLVELHRAYTEREASPFGLDYAGPW